MSKIDNVKEIENYFDTYGTFDGTGEEFAEECGLSHSQFSAALHWIRNNSDTLGWSIPHVSVGAGEKHWERITVTDSTLMGKEDRVAILRGGGHMVRQTETRLRTLGKSMSLISAHTDSRTIIGKRAKMIDTTISSLINSLDVLDYYEQVDREEKGP